MKAAFWRGAIVAGLVAAVAAAEEPSLRFPAGGTNAAGGALLAPPNEAMPGEFALGGFPSNAAPAGALAETHEPSADPMNSFDRWHERTSSNLMATVDRLDRFFGNDEAFEENRGTRVSVALGAEYSHLEGAKLKTRARARLALPYMERRLQLIFDSGGDVDDPEDVRAIADTVTKGEQFAGVRQVLKRTDWFSAHVDVGLRLGAHNPVFAKLRGRVAIPMGAWELRLSEQGRWYSADGFSEVSEIRLSRPLGESWLFQATSSCTLDELLDGVTLDQHVAIIHDVVGRAAYRLDLHGQWPEFPYVEKEEYRATITWRRRIHRDWLFLELTPGVSFPEEYDYEANAMITAFVEIVFGERH